MYDPLIESYPKPWQGYPASYWASELAKPADSELQQDIRTEVAIIGAGYTGLSAGYHLTKKYNADVTILEANEAGWGCSGRNAGFVLAGTGRLSLQQMASKWGQESAKHIYREYLNSIDSVNRMISLGNIQCDKTTGGYLKLAHKKDLVAGLRHQADVLRTQFSERVEFVDTKRVGEEFVKCQAYGGIYYPQCFAINPLKLVQGYQKLAIQSGVRLHTNSPVIQWKKDGSKHVLSTPKGTVTADSVIIASNGYTSKKMHPIVAKRHFPVLSSVIVTRPLTSDELREIGIKPGLMVMDTRALKYYYRILPDNRILFGGRGAIKGKDAEHQLYCQRLLDGLTSTFPQLKRVNAAYFWSGWISVSYDDYPRIWKNDDSSIHYAMGYCGSGVAFATQAGKRLAQSIMEPSKLPDLPFWQSPLPTFPFSPFKRLGLRGFYTLAKLRD